MKVFWTPKKILLLGIAVFLIGCIFPGRYENAQNTGHEIEATISDVVKREGEDFDTYTVYVDYEVDGEEYTHVKAGRFSKPYLEGDTMTVVINPKNPGKILQEGGILCVAGFVIACVGGVRMFRNRKQRKEKEEP